MGNWMEGCWNWKFQWRRPLRAWEEDSTQQLIEAINHRHPVQDAEDTWSWSLDVKGKYTTR
ncbi:hypothetical protein SLEP1_g15304 [Rubroshorea leprosula]|uniref:Uncharacterized protein n=1 Tax=Rubroshorea leprosula TaxID=152421 RepID=A0AAV5IWD9_9ROSI|nr:hypothetical protein SLEP1_g15304 [Rubroshorea leprosula]